MYVYLRIVAVQHATEREKNTGIERIHVYRRALFYNWRRALRRDLQSALKRTLLRVLPQIVTQTRLKSNSTYRFVCTRFNLWHSRQIKVVIHDSLLPVSFLWSRSLNLFAFLLHRIEAGESLPDNTRICRCVVCVFPSFFKRFLHFPWIALT